MKWLGIIIIGSLLPIWRRAGVEGYLNTWQYLNAALQAPMKHISVEEALRRAEASGYLKRPTYGATPV